MRTFLSLDYSDASKAIEAGMAEARSLGLSMAFAVTDHAGDLLYCTRMDGVPMRVLRHAMRKAFTAAEMGRDTLAFGRDLAERGGTLAQWGNSDLTTLQGGLVAKKAGEVVGGVACGGGPLEADEAVARSMLHSLGLQPVEDPRRPESR